MPPGRHVVRALDAAGARFRASAALSFSRPLHQPRAGIPAGTDEMCFVLHLLSHGASWRTFDFLGFRIKRLPRGRIPVAYSFPSERSFRDIKHRIKELTGRSNIGLSLDELIHALNPILRGWTNYHRHAA